MHRIPEIQRTRCLALWNQGLAVSQIKTRLGLSANRVNYILKGQDRAVKRQYLDSDPGVGGSHHTGSAGDTWRMS